MSTLDGLAAVSKMRGFTTYKAGYCLEAVAVAYGNPHSIGPHAGDFPYALKAWNNGLANHPNDLAGAPAGAPGYLSPGANGYGHVFLFAGNGLIVSTDTPTGGRVGLTTVESLCTRWGRHYLGWQSNFIGYDLVNLGAAYGGVANPTLPAASGGAQNPFGISDVRGLQKISKMYGGNTAPDNIWGAGSSSGFAQFLRRNWGYSGNDVLGPNMWAAIARWLRARWGYKGNDVPGPVMRSALQYASNQNLAAL